MPELLVLPSPFLGPAAYAGLAAALAGEGVAATVATYDDPPVAHRLVEQWAAQAGDGDDLVLLAHSNAGFLAPLVSHRRGGCPIVFVDAALLPERGTTALAPPGLREDLAELVGTDGRLPPWTRWWPRGELAAVLPDPWFERLDDTVPRVPLDYVDGVVEAPPAWRAGVCAYLALGPETYAAELARAAAAGWPVAVLEGAQHLHPVVEPHDTARAVLGLLARLDP